MAVNGIRRRWHVLEELQVIDLKEFFEFSKPGTDIG
jgi:hypothetical protein